ncbi:hypothetical protein QBC42DRAFT_342494 [Cladorrhinum samala]|uniref:Chromo domain-containing protein n=1 Tax=Cladorrhinum samala TaxID=585594 RepID=A0AAV9I4U0_9PEZI|nr:hypothetical protein QBC42DRAFT_342494 [Cladorrhinum samala]
MASDKAGQACPSNPERVLLHVGDDVPITPCRIWTRHLALESRARRTTKFQSSPPSQLKSLRLAYLPRLATRPCFRKPIALDSAHSHVTHQVPEQGAETVDSAASSRAKTTPSRAEAARRGSQHRAATPSSLHAASMPKRHRKKYSTRPAKRRRPSARHREEEYYELRDILDEKTEEGELWYLVDWENDASTGKEYEPSWELATNVTKPAIDAWEEKKLQRGGQDTIRTSPAVAESGNQPAHPASSKRRRSHSSADGRDPSPKRARTAVGLDRTSSPEDSAPKLGPQKVEIIVDISAAPAVDPSEYTFIPASQTSAVAKDAASQRTIPDSQEDSITQSTLAAFTDITESQQAQSAAEGIVVDQSVPEVSLTEIPSHQPGHSAEHCEAPSVLLDRESRSGSLALDSGAEPLNASVDEAEIATVSSAGEFLTQPPYYDIPLPSQEFRNPIRDSPSPSTSSISDFKSATSSPLLSYQAAQLVQPIPSDNDGSGHIITQTREPSERSQEGAILEATSTAQDGKSTSGVSNLIVSRSRLSTLAKSDQNSIQFSPWSGRSYNKRPPALSLRSMDPPPPSGPLWGEGRDAIQELKAAIPNFNSQPFNPSQDILPHPERGMQPAVERAAFRDAREELRAAIPKFDFLGSRPSEGAEATSPEPPKFRSAVDELREGMNSALARQREKMGGDPSSPPFSFLNAPTPNLSTQLPVIGAHNPAFEQLPTTVAPSDLTTSLELPQVVDHDSEMFTDNPQVYEPPVPLSVSPNADSVPDETEDEHQRLIVTLPMAANTRSMYLDTVKKNRAIMSQFGSIFSDSLSRVPDPSLVAKIDSFFESLQKFCDLPAYWDSLPSMTAQEKTKHATNSNSKFSFVYEFLMALSGVHARVLILSLPGLVSQYLEALVATILDSLKELGPIPSITTADVSENLSKFQGAGIDVVILFDEAARSAKLPTNLGYESTLVLALTTTYSVEHIDLELRQEEPDLKGLEKKNALNLAIAQVQKYLETPERGYPEPHDAAETFANFLKNPESGISWGHQYLPSDVFELWRSSQIPDTQTDTPETSNIRKRPLIDDNIIVTKRPKMMERAASAQISELLRDCLAAHAITEANHTATMNVPIAQLERLAAKIFNLEEKLASQNTLYSQMRDLAKSQENQRLSWEKTVKRFEPKYLEALNDRKKFEKEAKEATKEATKKVKEVEEQLETRKAEVESLKERVRVLESDLSSATNALQNSSIPEVAKLAQLEQELKDERAQTEVFKSKAAKLEEHAEYLRQRHQDSSSEHGLRERQITELQQEIAQLKQRDTSNALKAQQIHAKNEFNIMTKQIKEQKAIIYDRERELDRVKDELKTLKSNRRETRSPRPGGVMSPRPSRSATAAGSRGTSPALPPSSDPAAPGEQVGAALKKKTGRAAKSNAKPAQTDTNTNTVSYKRVTRSKMNTDALEAPAKFNFDALVTPEKNRDALGRTAMDVDSSPPTFQTNLGAAKKMKETATEDTKRRRTGGAAKRLASIAKPVNK